ncbi:MAG: aminotransferase class I/II-fold pyridoxal phosphate-dependent enzyme [Variovorax sp.]|nr:MAG: aminotransferase class I/II-fold pyridoxal phosphate-dependent enzyme [Variovorax sp.]
MTHDRDAMFLHGGPDDGAPVRHDFSTNANACGPCPEVLAAVRRADATRYPDPRYTALRERLARFHGVDARRIAIAASASEFVFRITAAIARRGGRGVALPTHGYGDYARAAQAWGLVPGRASDARLDLPRPEEPPALAWHCDPSSPLGQPVPALGDRIDALAPSTACVLDLAYEPLRLEGCLDLTRARMDRVWQLWTPNKALGLTGVRAAYAIAPLEGSELVEDLRCMAPSWAAGSQGVAMLEGWCDAAAQDWMTSSRALLRAWRTRQLALCGELGWRLQPTVANFLCADPGVVDLTAWASSLRDQGIKVRDATSFGLRDHCRIAVLAPHAQDALRAALLSGPSFPRRASLPASRSRLPS